MKLTIIGYGITGKAIVDAFKNKHELVMIDPQRSLNELNEHHDSDGIIICTEDQSELFDTLNKVPIFLPVLIRSKVSLETVEKISQLYAEHSIVISPDFSRPNSADIDFVNQKYVVLGGEDPEGFWQDLFQTALPNCSLVFTCTGKEAALIKYATAGFFALKSLYFNQLFDLCQTSHLDFDSIRQIMSHDPRINSDYTIVPGLDGRRGIEDIDSVNELIQWSDSIEEPLSVLKNSMEYNSLIRKTA